MDVKYQIRCKAGLGISWSTAAMLCDVIAGRTRPRSIPLAMLTRKEELHGFLFLCMHVVLFLELCCSAWRPLRPPELRYQIELFGVCITLLVHKHVHKKIAALLTSRLVTYPCISPYCAKTIFLRSFPQDSNKCILGFMPHGPSD